MKILKKSGILCVYLLLIHKDKDQTEVQWDFQGMETSMGVATYDNILLKEIKSHYYQRKIFRND